MTQLLRGRRLVLCALMALFFPIIAVFHVKDAKVLTLGDIHHLLCLLTVLLIFFTLWRGICLAEHASLEWATLATLMWGVIAPLALDGPSHLPISRKLQPIVFPPFGLNKSKLGIM
jgi:hypothetical protein